MKKARGGKSHATIPLNYIKGKQMHLDIYEYTPTETGASGLTCRNISKIHNTVDENICKASSLPTYDSGVCA
jgi:hypothetical protein